MRKTLVATIIITSLGLVSNNAISQTHKQKKEHEKAVGLSLGAGVVVGAAVAGPVGAIAAGLLGAVITNDHYQDKAIKEQEDEIASQKAVLSNKQQQIVAMKSAFEQLQQEKQAIEVIASNLDEARNMKVETSIQFTTGSHLLEEDYQEQLNLIAEALVNHENLKVKLTGHADNRGSDSFNQALSMQRALTVKQYLIDFGVDESQIESLAMGESQSQGDNFETAFFDRKVVVSVSENSPAYAITQN